MGIADKNLSEELQVRSEQPREVECKCLALCQPHWASAPREGCGTEEENTQGEAEDCGMPSCRIAHHSQEDQGRGGERDVEMWSKKDAEERDSSLGSHSFWAPGLNGCGPPRVLTLSRGRQGRQLRRQSARLESVRILV